MSRDVVTLLIVIFCIAALIFLIVKTVNLSSSKVSEPGQDSNYLYDDSTDGGIAGEDTTGFYDLDTAVTADEGGIVEQPAVEYTGKDKIATPAKERETSVPSSFDAEGDYLVIAGSYRFKANAESEARRLQRLGYTDAEVALFNRGAYASVIVSRHTSLTSAQDQVRELKRDHGVEAYVQVRKGSR